MLKVVDIKFIAPRFVFLVTNSALTVSLRERLIGLMFTEQKSYF